MGQSQYVAGHRAEILCQITFGIVPVIPDVGANTKDTGAYATLLNGGGTRRHEAARGGPNHDG